MPAVSNSTPLIYLASLGDLDLIRHLFGRILMPHAVYDEVVTNGSGKQGADLVREAAKSWLDVVFVGNHRRVETLVQSGLDLGEAETIALAQETAESFILMDDRSAIEEARAAGLDVVRTAAFYVIAKQHRLVPRVQPKLDALRGAGFWLSDAHYRAILKLAAEA